MTVVRVNQVEEKASPQGESSPYLSIAETASWDTPPTAACKSGPNRRGESATEIGGTISGAQTTSQRTEIPVARALQEEHEPEPRDSSL